MKNAFRKRRRLLVRPRLQVRIALAFLSAACTCTLVQVLLLAHSLSTLAETLPTEGGLIVERMPTILRNQVLLTFVLMAPLMIAVGVLETFRVLGPLYRFEQYLRAIARGQRPEPCRIRKNDELQDFCQVLNQATQPLLRGAPAGDPSQTSASTDPDSPPSLVDRPAVEVPGGQQGT
jgi:hypothetical protein